MCVILFAHKAHPDFPLIVAANRDESFVRPAASLAFWSDLPHVCGGRDLEKGGTWLGMTRQGRVAAVTNYRDPSVPRNGTLSRGELVKDFLAGNTPAEYYLNEVSTRGNLYNGFILIAGDLERLMWYSNRGPGVEAIEPGVHGLSNHLLNTPWPKIVRARQALSSLIGADEAALTAGLFEVLADRSQAPDHELPETGVGLQRERELSSVFVPGEQYGTRASTVLLVSRGGRVTMIERSFGPRGRPAGAVAQRFDLDRVTRRGADAG